MATARQLKDKENFEKEKRDFENYIDKLASAVFSPNPDAKEIHNIIYDNLSQYAKLHAPYSEYNTSWLNQQMREKYAKKQVDTPFLTFPANFKHWSNLTNDKGEQVKVKAGAKALLVLKPKIVKEKIKANEADDQNLNTDDQKKDLKENIFQEKVIGFVPIKVFDVSQTNAIEIGAIKPIDWDKIGENDEIKNQAYVKALNYISNAIPNKYDVTISFDKNDKQFENGALMGYYSPSSNSIHIKDELPNNLKLSVLAHELGHYLCKHSEKNLSTNVEEMQAEAFSYLLTAKMGISDTFHVDYIQQHLMKEVKKSYSELTTGDLNDKSHLSNLRKAFNNIMDKIKEPYKDFYNNIKFGTFLEREIAPMLQNKSNIGEDIKILTDIKENNNEVIKIK